MITVTKKIFVNVHPKNPKNYELILLHVPSSSLLDVKATDQNTISSNALNDITTSIIRGIKDVLKILCLAKRVDCEDVESSAPKNLTQFKKIFGRCRQS